jgi:hypothetical protein
METVKKRIRGQPETVEELRARIPQACNATFTKHTKKFSRSLGTLSSNLGCRAILFKSRITRTFLFIAKSIIIIYSPIANTFRIKAECFYNLTGRGV